MVLIFVILHSRERLLGNQSRSDDRLNSVAPLGCFKVALGTTMGTLVITLAAPLSLYRVGAAGGLSPVRNVPLLNGRFLRRLVELRLMGRRRLPEVAWDLVC